MVKLANTSSQTLEISQQVIQPNNSQNEKMTEDGACYSSSTYHLMGDSSSSSSSESDGPLYQLSELMAQLPIKRGLSKYYQGKSQSFGALTSVESLEDLAKRENPNRRKSLKYCKSYRFCSPTSMISKKTSSTTHFFTKLERSRSYHLMATSYSSPSVLKHI